MAKKKNRLKSKPVKHNIPVAKKPLSDRTKSLIAFGVVILILLIILKPLVVDNLVPEGVDTIAYKASSKQIIDYQDNTGDEALWNPAIFAGMPVYQLKNATNFSVDGIINFLGQTTNSTFIYLITGALGLFLLLRYLKFTPIIALFCTLILILMPHYTSLYLVGHFAKLRALMVLPWVILAFIHFLDKRSILSAALFALSFGTQIRSHHYQIVFYTAMLVLFIGFYPVINDLLKKQYVAFFKTLSMLLIALMLGILMSAQPILSAREYLPYSKRGKTTVDIRDTQPVAATGGVSMEYATQWSTHPSEMMTWLIPRFYGGTSAEYYEGKDVPQLRKRMIPSYWGYMPFTQSYEYMGVATLILAVLGIYMFRKKPLVAGMFFCMIFLIILSFGRHFQTFYAFFYDFFPYFDKFRVPMMSVSVTSFIMIVLAAFGLRSLSELTTGENIREFRHIFYILGAFLVLGVLAYLFSQGFSYESLRDNYAPQIIEMIKQVRMEYFTQDILRYFFLLLISAAAIVLYILKKFRYNILFLILAVVMLIDLLNIHSRYNVNYVNADRMEKEYFQKNSTDIFLEQDEDLFRILPVGELFNDNHWAYYHETIGGYTPIKMYTIEEIITNNLYAGWNKELPINSNILKILNVKYLISKMQLSRSDLILTHVDQSKNHFVYEFRDYQPRGYFVGQTVTIPDEFERLKHLNQEAFDPAHSAVIEENLQQEIHSPDSSWVKITEYTVNRLTFETYTDKQSLFVSSVMYYPPGWEIKMDGQTVTSIYKTNHAVQSFIVPAGTHVIEMNFDPDSYHKNIAVSYASLIFIYLAVVIPLIYQNRDRISNLFQRRTGDSDPGK